MGDFQELDVWKLAKELAVYIYKVTKTGSFNKDFGFRDQIRRAAISVSSNIGEGEESGSIKLSIRYLNIAKGSNAEVKSQAIVAHEIGFINEDQKKSIVSKCENISKKLYFLIMYRKNKLNNK
jgi:four helix bundle protein